MVTIEAPRTDEVTEAGYDISAFEKAFEDPKSESGIESDLGSALVPIENPELYGSTGILIASLSSKSGGNYILNYVTIIGIGEDNHPIGGWGDKKVELIKYNGNPSYYYVQRENEKNRDVVSKLPFELCPIDQGLYQKFIQGLESGSLTDTVVSMYDKIASTLDGFEVVNGGLKMPKNYAAHNMNTIS